MEKKKNSTHLDKKILTQATSTNLNALIIFFETKIEREKNTMLVNKVYLFHHIFISTVKFAHNNWYLLGFSCKKTKKYCELGLKTINMNSVSKTENSKTGMTSSDYEVTLEIDIFPSLLQHFISMLCFCVCEGKVKNREEIFSGGLCQDLSEKVIMS